MRENTPSETAERTTFVRAWESRLPESVRVCYDPLAEHLLGPKYKMHFVNRLLFRLMAWRARRRRIGLFEYIVSRTRYIDECVQSCMDEGLQQMVILGAGYDSRAYRFEGLKRVKVFEVDHPATQRAKAERISMALGSMPQNVAYVPVDFDKESIGERLLETGYDPGLKTLFIGEGLTYYLTAEAVDAILELVAKNFGDGSAIIFDYIPPNIADGSNLPPATRAMLRRVIPSSERVGLGIEEARIEEYLAGKGFQLVNTVSHDYLKNEYFHGANRDRPLMQGMSIAYATVLPRS